MGETTDGDLAIAVDIYTMRATRAGEFARNSQAIRFQASTHRLTAVSFPVNHPKNSMGYALALATEGETRDQYAEYVINEVRGGRRGAILLGLVEDGPEGETLTHLGAEVVRFAKTQSGGVVNYPIMLALLRSLRVGLPDSTTRFFTDGRRAPTVRAGNAVSTGVDSECPTPTRW